MVLSPMFKITFRDPESLQVTFGEGVIPPQYADTTGDTGTPSDVLEGVIVDTNVNGHAVKIEGTMPNNGELSLSFDGLTDDKVAIPEGYASGGFAFLTDDIAALLAAY